MKILWMHANSVSFVPALVRMDDERKWQWRRSRRWRGGTLIRWEERVTYRHKDNMISITIHETVAIQTTVTRTVTFRNFRRLCQTFLLLSLKRIRWFFNINKVILSTLQKASSQQFLGTIPPTQTRQRLDMKPGVAPTDCYANWLTVLFPRFLTLHMRWTVFPTKPVTFDETVVSK